MAERKFDYANIESIYNQTKNIIGDVNYPDSIAGLLQEMTNTVYQEVQVQNEAIYGDLGEQYLLNYDNISSNFASFISKFKDWTDLIAASAGDYSQFESEVSGLKNANPLGLTSGGVQTSFVNTGTFSEFTRENYEEMSDYNHQLYDLTGVQYVSSNSTSLLEGRVLGEWINWGVNTVKVASGVCAAVGAFSSAASAGAEGATAAGEGTNAATSAIENTGAQVAQQAASTTTQLTLEDGTIAVQNSAGQWINQATGQYVSKAAVEAAQQSAATVASGSTSTVAQLTLENGHPIIQNSAGRYIDGVTKRYVSNSTVEAAKAAASNAGTVSAADTAGAASTAVKTATGTTSFFGKIKNTGTALKSFGNKISTGVSNGVKSVTEKIGSTKIGSGLINGAKSAGTFVANHKGAVAVGAAGLTGAAIYSANKK